jgi:hypothetical protein
VQCRSGQVSVGELGEAEQSAECGGAGEAARPGFHMQRSGSYKRATRIIAIAVTPPASSPPLQLCSRQCLAVTLPCRP